MFKTICDRCGVDMTPKEKTLADLLCKTINDGLSFCFKTKVKQTYKVVSADESVEVHLCDKCDAELQKFMSGASYQLMIIDEKKEG